MLSKLLKWTLLGCSMFAANGETIVSIDGSAAVFGQPGTAAGWGIDITSDVFPLFTGSQFTPDPNGVGTYMDYLASSFVFGIAGQTVTSPFDAFAQTGAGEFDISNSASLGSILFGDVQVFWDEYSVSPDDPGFDPSADFISSGNSVLLPVSVTVGTQGTLVPAPEPSSLSLAMIGAALLFNRRLLGSKLVRRVLVKAAMFLFFFTALSGIAPKAFADDGPPNPTAAEKQALEIIRNQEVAAPTQECHADSDPSVKTNCCGSPGMAGCVSGFSYQAVAKANTCTIPGSNALQIDLDHRVLCNLPKTNCDTRIGTSIQSHEKAGPQDVTFYFTSDIHWFRNNNFLPETQIRHVQVLNGFPNTFPWLAANPPFSTADKVGTPAGLVIGGDFSSFGSSQELGAQRLLYEPQIDASISYPVFVGLGNHDSFTQNSSTGAQRMFEYIANAMNCGGTHFDSGSDNYSWDWGRLHLVMLNTWAGDQKSLYVHTSDGLTWLQNDLQTNVGQTGRPVIIFQHDGLDCFSYSDVSDCPDTQAPDPAHGVWNPSDTTRFLNAIRDFNIVALFNGHTHSAAVNRLDQTYYAKPISGETPVLTDSHGNQRIFDIFTSGTGGSQGGDDPTGSGDFIVARFTDGSDPDSAPYLDVQTMHWTSTGVVAKTELGQNTYFGGFNGCRKRIDSRFNDLPLISAQLSGNVANTDTRTVTLTNPRHQILQGPLAVRVQSPNDSGLGVLQHYDFVDFCGSPGTGPEFKSSSFILLTDVQIDALNAGVQVLVTLNFVNDSTTTPINVALSSITPLRGATPSSFSPAVGPTDKLPLSFTAFGAPNSSLFLSAAYTDAKNPDGSLIAQGWLTNVTVNNASCAVSPGCAGTFDVSGRAVVNFVVDATALVNKNIAQPNAIFTIDAASGAQGLAATVTVSPKLKTPMVIKVTTLTPSPYVVSTGPAVIEAQFFAANGVSEPSVTDSNNDVHHPSGRVFLSEATLDSSGNVVSAAPITYVTYLNKGELCSDLFNIPNPPNGNLPGNETVVFGDVGDQNGKQGFCPSFAYPGTNPFDSANTLTFRLHHFVVQYEGDSNFTPAMSTPFDYLVEIPLVSISVFDGNNQSTQTGTPFAQPIRAKVLQAANATQSGVPVTFTAPSSGATGVFAGNVSAVTVLTDTNGIATAPVFNANTSDGHYTITASTQGLSTTFSATNLPPGTPLLTATIGTKSGPTNARIWPVKITNTQVDAFNVAVTQMTFTQVAGTACTPVLLTPLPTAVGDIAGGASGTTNIVVDSSACGSGTRFTVQIGVTANGNYQKTTTIGNQFP